MEVRGNLTFASLRFKLVGVIEDICRFVVLMSQRLTRERLTKFYLLSIMLLDKPLYRLQSVHEVVIAAILSNLMGVFDTALFDHCVDLNYSL